MATEDIRWGMNQTTLNTLNFFFPNSRKVAMASPNGIWIRIDSAIMIRLLPAALLKFPSMNKVFQFFHPINSLPAEIPFHLKKLIWNDSIIGYMTNTARNINTGAKNSIPVSSISLLRREARAFVFFFIPLSSIRFLLIKVMIARAKTGKNRFFCPFSIIFFV